MSTIEFIILQHLPKIQKHKVLEVLDLPQ